MHITIECLSGSLTGKVFTFDQAEIGLGRGENQKKEIDFADSDIGVSRNHALISVREQRVYLVDQSRGGTLIRGQRIQGTTFELHSGEEVQLGGPSGPRLRVRFRAMTQVEPPRGETGISEPPAPLPPTVHLTPAHPLPPAAPLPLPPIGAPLPPGPSPRPGPAPVQNSETLIQLQPEAAPPGPVLNQETMLQPPTADQPYRQAQPSNRPYQSPPEMRAEDATYFQGTGEAGYPTPRPKVGRPLPVGLANSGKTVLQTPAPTHDTDPTVLQEDHFPWLPFSLIGPATVALLGVVWVFLLHQPIYFFLPLPIVLVLALGAFFFWRRRS